MEGAQSHSSKGKNFRGEWHRGGLKRAGLCGGVSLRVGLLHPPPQSSWLFGSTVLEGRDLGGTWTLWLPTLSLAPFYILSFTVLWLKAKETNSG